MAYLLIAALVSVVGITFVLWRNHRPTGMRHSISEFERNRRAIAPERPVRRRRSSE